ncbi:MAG: hypothetical protein ISR83_04645 [Candidatus Marinimicrobia bacterium]|nr:hypothetical protein [Candidatus Neomarinimicrobiota bacterium]
MAAKRKRKRISRTEISYLREYSYEIKVAIIFALGVFLLVEKLEIKHYLYLWVRGTLFFIGDIIKSVAGGFEFVIGTFETSDIVGIILIITAFFMVSKRWRERTIERNSSLINCPNCDGDFKRIRRTSYQRLQSFFWWVKVKHYECKNCSQTYMQMTERRS